MPLMLELGLLRTLPESSSSDPLYKNKNKFLCLKSAQLFKPVSDILAIL
jgi:hypothetical protein